MRREEQQRLAALIARESGIVVSDARLGSLGAALRRIDPALAASDLLGNEDPVRRVGLVSRLIDEVAVNETYFLRHADELQGLDWPSLAFDAHRRARPLRVWSAACSSGEEAYTLAMMIAEALGATTTAVDILGTDISGSALARAEQGIYTARSLRLVSAQRRERWLEPSTPGGLRVGPQLRGMVRFERHNLVRDPLPPAGEALFDVIVCRNVLIYFDPDTIARTVPGMREAIASQGHLVLGAADRLGLRAVPDADSEGAAPRRHPVGRRRAPVTPKREPSRARATVHRTERAQHGSDAAVVAFEEGVEALQRGEGTAAVTKLRRAVYLAPDFAVAAMQLGRAHEEIGQVAAARRAYWRALRLAEDAELPVSRLYDRIGAADVAAACRARLSALPTRDQGESANA
jgi:chemotaxis protein methyltransferase CheR